MFQIKRD